MEKKFESKSEMEVAGDVMNIGQPGSLSNKGLFNCLEIALECENLERKF